MPHIYTHIHVPTHPMARSLACSRLSKPSSASASALPIYTTRSVSESTNQSVKPAPTYTQGMTPTKTCTHQNPTYPPVKRRLLRRRRGRQRHLLLRAAPLDEGVLLLFVLWALVLSRKDRGARGHGSKYIDTRQTQPKSQIPPPLHKTPRPLSPYLHPPPLPQRLHLPAQPLLPRPLLRPPRLELCHLWYVNERVIIGKTG